MSRVASCRLRGRTLVAAVSLVAALATLGGGAARLAAQAPRTTVSHALRVSASFPLRELARDSLRVASMGATPALGVAILPAHGPLQRILLDAAPAMLRVDGGSGCTEFNGYVCESQAVYGVALAAALETGARARISRARVLYAVAGPALRLHGYVARPRCATAELLCREADRLSSTEVGLGGHAALGLRHAGPGRHLSTEAALTVVTYPGAQTQIDLGVTVAFPF